MNLRLVRIKIYTSNRKQEERMKKSEMTVDTTISPSWKHLYIFLSLDTEMIVSKKKKLNSCEMYR